MSKTQTLPALQAIAALEKIAEYVVKSKLFGVKTKEEAVALMLLAQAEGMHPMTAIKEYYIIHGRPALRADAMLARFQKAGGKVEWHVLDDTKAKATFYHPQGGKVTIEWDIERARKAGLVKEDSAWLKYPRAMLRARVISEGVRAVYPAVTTGVYTPEEIQDMTEEEMLAIEAIQEPIEQETYKLEANTEAAETTEEQITKSEKSATEKQIGFIKQLMETKGFTDEDWKYLTLEIIGKEKDMDTLTSVEASKIIDFLRDAKRVSLSESQKNVLRNRLINLKLPENAVERIVENINYDDFILLSQAIQEGDKNTFVSILNKYGISVKSKGSVEDKTTQKEVPPIEEWPKDEEEYEDEERIPF